MEEKKKHTRSQSLSLTHTQAWEIAVNERKAKNSKDVYPGGAGNEEFEFWKYGKLIGTIRKRYVMEDRQVV